MTPGESAEAGWRSLETLGDGVGDEFWYVHRYVSGRFLKRYGEKQCRQGYRRLTRRMLGDMLHGLGGVIVVHGTIIFMMMMAYTIVMCKRMGNVECMAVRKPSALHGKAMQREKHQQENADKTTHGFQS